MFCYQCGTQLEDGSLFCHNCGTKILDGDVSKEISDSFVMVQEQESSVLSEKLHQVDAVVNEQNIELVNAPEDNEKFKEFVNKYVSETTKFQSAEELLNSKVPRKFLWICFGVPAILLFILFICNPSFESILVIVFLFLFIVYPIVLSADYIFSFLVTRGEYKTNRSIDTDELILFLNRNLSYLSPYFNEWNYIKMVGYGVRGMTVAAVQNALLGTRIGTGFGRRQRCFVEIHINPDHANPDSGQMVYHFSTAIKSIWPACYACKIKAVPVLQAAMKYYLKEYGTERNDFSTVIQNPETEKKTNYVAQQVSVNRTFPDTYNYGNNIKPYYCGQFDRIAHGQKAKFNWAAFFFNGWMQLYNGCSKVFCKTFLPWLLIYFIVSLIRIVSIRNLNMTWMWVTSVLFMLLGIGGFVLSIVNGFKFNEWFYQDVINNPGKKRSRKGLWFLIVAEIAIIVILQLTGRLLAKHVIDSFVDSYDESDDDLDNDLNGNFYEDFYSDFYEDSLDDANEDLLVEHSEDLVSIQGEDIEDSMIDVAQYEGAAREIIMEWFSRHPLQHNFRIKFMNETTNTEDGSGIYLNYEMFWGNDEWYGSFCVNPASGDMIMDSMIKATGITTVQESMDQWYMEDYWFLGEDLGGYSELYEDNIYFLYNRYNEDGNPILEYYAENDSYGICDYDGQCLIEYDDGSETSEISIMDFAGTFGYDGSFEAEGMFVNFYYLLEIGEWDGYCFSIDETWRGNAILQDEYARPKSLIVDTLTFEIFNPDVGYETHSLTYVPAKSLPLGQDVIYLDGDDTMPFVRE